MEQKTARYPIGASTVMTQNDETMGSFMGLTREQKREILTHALISGAERSALLREDRTELRN